MNNRSRILVCSIIFIAALFVVTSPALADPPTPQPFLAEEVVPYVDDDQGGDPPLGEKTCWTFFLARGYGGGSRWPPNHQGYRYAYGITYIDGVVHDGNKDQYLFWSHDFGIAGWAFINDYYPPHNNVFNWNEDPCNRNNHAHCMDDFNPIPEVLVFDGDSYPLLTGGTIGQGGTCGTARCRVSTAVRSVRL